MILVFSRTSERTYAVEAQRPGSPQMLMSPAPGFDPLMPHDMMHLVVEAQLGLRHGIFGQLAAGGNAGTFQLPMKSGENSRDVTRARKRVANRGKRLLKRNRNECQQSERATFICLCEWRARSAPHDRRMAQQAREVRETIAARKLRLNQTKLDEICKHLDELSSHWLGLTVGQSMAVRWPDLAIVSTAAAPLSCSAEGQHQGHYAYTPQQKLNDYH